MADELWTIGRLLKWTEQYFQKAGVDSPRLDSEVLLCHVLKKERIYLYVHFDQPLSNEELAEFKSYIKQRVQHKPVAYIVGHKDFMGLDFIVTEDTLIPRPDTEILVETVIFRLKTGAGDIGAIADIGTGSGAICLSLLKYLSSLQAVSVDVSAEAIAVARENAQRMGLSSRIEFLQGDLLEPVKDRKFIAIVSNPPYIPAGDIVSLDQDVKSFEPELALNGGEDGLDFYRRLVVDSLPLLEDEGFLAMEIGINQSDALVELAEKAGWGRIEIVKDLAGINRVVVLWKQK
ncbi:MAG: peptide chain release factor N(5)-glutamine methyltransferase [Anaerovibrio sp.]|uniref:peptide chain release factor N(5)-glutamine methyltransferase n=1 Tax=Anaerovibrio sp. TaxID=1872532 RepID=UPI0025F6ABBD|nr:peptide chain release factor N(5)-glutamine methyltransferase [Anaerovibrio sp.]MCR5175227.1 peptide chain release factor N(5)-glutamine methyltransferase [Anaerovibrio sp.]